jgi:myo-inositol-1(or 4)-monophosphatase
VEPGSNGEDPAEARRGRVATAAAVGGGQTSTAAVEVEALLEVASECARRAGALLLEHFAAPARAVRAKSGPRDLVSAADFAAEEAIRSVLARERPGDGVLGEELDETASLTGLRWVVDPLDGTVNFLRRLPHWCVSIACEDADGARVGVVYDPLRREWFTAARGRGASLGPVQLHGSRASDLALAMVGGELSARSPTEAGRSRALVSSACHVRSYGSAALDLAWVAAGRFDAVYHGRFPSPWDLSAGSLLCREAGLVIERVTGDADSDSSLLAAPSALALPLRKLIADANSGP